MKRAVSSTHTVMAEMFCNPGIFPENLQFFQKCVGIHVYCLHVHCINTISNFFALYTKIHKTFVIATSIWEILIF